MKIKEFQKIMKERGIDASIFYNMETNSENANMRYLSNYSGYGFLVVPANKNPKLFVPVLDIERAFKSGTRFTIIKKDIFNKICEYIKGAKTIGIEEKKFSIFANKKIGKILKGIKFKDVSPILSDLRKIKTREEVEIIREASAITNGIMSSCIRNIKKFRTEKEIANFLKVECFKKNVEPAFDFVVASGRNPASPHHEPSNKKISKGFCVIDFGVRHKGYCTDITRTVYFGNPSQKEVKLYNLVLHTQQEAIKDLAIGKKFCEIEQRARKNLGNKSKYFIHSLGHGLGLEVHEEPLVSENSKDSIREGMFFTIEPGIYMIGRRGIRIEDDILIFNGKVECLTNVTKELIIIEKPKPYKSLYFKL